MPWRFASTPISRAASSASTAATGSSTAALTLTRPVYKQFSAGFGVWGGAQPGVYRRRCRPARDDARARQHHASISTGASGWPAMPRPGSGPAVTLGGRFLDRRVAWPGRRFAASPRPRHGHLPPDRRPVGQRAVDRRAGLPRRRAVGHVRRRRRLPDHAAADLLRHPADRRGRLGDDPDHRRQRVGRDGPHAPRRGRPEDGRR